MATQKNNDLDQVVTSIEVTQRIWKRATLQDYLIFQYQTERIEARLIWWQESHEDRPLVFVRNENRPFSFVSKFFTKSTLLLIWK